MSACRRFPHPSLLSSLALLLPALLLSLVAAPPAGATDPLEDPAYDLLHQRVRANEDAFYVYRDSDSGFNRGFPSGLFASSAEALAKITIDAACVDDGTAANGCSSDLDALDRQRGTVLRITFEPLASGEFVGINVEEPENWGAAPRGTGYDLRGSENLVLDVRSPDGVRVRFGVGGSSSGFVTLPESWTPLSLPLASLVPDPGQAPLDPGNVHRLLTVVTNDLNAPAGGTVLLDDVRFEPVPSSHPERESFPLGTRTFGVVPRQTAAPGRVPFPSDQVLRNLTTTYESALVMLALADRGTAEDLADLRRLADAFHVALHNDNQGDPLPEAPDGSGPPAGGRVQDGIRPPPDPRDTNHGRRHAPTQTLRTPARYRDHRRVPGPGNRGLHLSEVERRAALQAWRLAGRQRW